MIKPKKLNKIPISSFTAVQVGELLGVSTATIYNYKKIGKRVSNDLYIKLKDTGSKILKNDIIDFINAIKKLKNNENL